MPPKRKKRKLVFGCTSKGGKQKQSRYNWAEARDAIGLPGANSQQITSALTIDMNSVPAGRSPLKKEVKAMLQQEKERSSYLELENE